MVIYVARCRDEKEASQLQGKLMSCCPTLVSSRILKGVKELDFFNAQLLRAQDEHFIPGQLAFEQKQTEKPRSYFKWPLYLVAALCFGLAAFLLGRLFAVEQADTPAIVVSIVWTVVFATLGVLAVVAAWFMTTRQRPADERVYESAEKWLRKGRPVVIASSEDMPIAECELPKTVSIFDRDTREPIRRSA